MSKDPDNLPHQASTLALLSEYIPLKGGYVTSTGSYVLDWSSDPQNQVSLGIEEGGSLWASIYYLGNIVTHRWTCDGSELPPGVVDFLQDSIISRGPADCD